MNLLHKTITFYVLETPMFWDDLNFGTPLSLGGWVRPSLKSLKTGFLRIKLSQIAAGEKFKFTDEYDFGDSWEHELLLKNFCSGKVYYV